MKIRPFRKSDIPTLSEAFMEAWLNEGVGEEWNSETAKEYIIHLSRKADIFLVADISGRAVGGFAAEVKQWWDGKRLNGLELFVQPAFQGKGKALMKEMVRAGMERGAEKFEGFTYKNSRADKWYMRIGMKHADELVMVEGEIQKILQNLNI